jgi:fructose-1,6-bisphosphatase/sedoheptulose 1,7-bisphosphatase-like protein
MACRAITICCMRTCLAIVLTAGLAGCGLAGTAATTAVGGSVELKQAQTARQTEDRVRQQVDQATHQHVEQIDQTEKDAQ